jgi:hypothetical protein
MVCRSISDPIVAKIQYAECLCVEKKMNMREMKIGLKSPSGLVRRW